MLFEHHTWTSFEFVYVMTQVFVAIGTVFLAVFTAAVAYKSYKENWIADWLKLEFAYLTESKKNNMLNICLDLRNVGKMPIKVSHAVVFFLGTNRILDNMHFSSKELQEIPMMDLTPIILEPVKLKNVGAEVRNVYDVEEFHLEKLKDLDIEKVKRIRVGVVTNMKYYKFDLSEEEIFNMLQHLKEFRTELENQPKTLEVK